MSGGGGGGGKEALDDGDENDGDEWRTRSERLAERAAEAREAAIAASRLAMVVLRGSMWQPLVS